MAVITIIIVESEEQFLFGIPQTLTLSTNIPATIFYTLDGSEPTTSSLVYVSPIIMPRDQTSVTFKAFATDGVDTCPVITQIYKPNIEVTRRPMDKVTLSSKEPKEAIFPYGSNTTESPYVWGSFGPSGAIVDKPGTENIPDGYDGSGTATYANGTDLPLEEYLIRFSETNYLGERGRGLGTVPTQNTLVTVDPPPQSSNINDRMFDPRAMVIYQDSREDPRDPDIVHFNRASFSLQDSNEYKEKNAALLHATGFEKSGASGSFVRSTFNPRENTTTYYYFDSQTLRWIISTEPAQTSPTNQSLSNIVFSSRGSGSRYIYKWIHFKRSRLI